MIQRLIDFLLCRPSQKEKRLVSEIRAKSQNIFDICSKNLGGTEQKDTLFKIAWDTAQALGRIEANYGLEGWKEQDEPHTEVQALEVTQE